MKLVYNMCDEVNIKYMDFMLAGLWVLYTSQSHPYGWHISPNVFGCNGILNVFLSLWAILLNVHELLSH